MGLDTVELVMAFEEAFALRIPNPVAERLQTVRGVIDYVASEKSTVPSTACCTQQTFYRVRRALAAAVHPARRVAPVTRLSALADGESWPRVWRRARAAATAADWPAEVPWKGWWRDGPETVGELALYLVATRRPIGGRGAEPWTRDEITRVVRQVIHEEQGIWKVMLDDSFVEDLGVD